MYLLNKRYAPGTSIYISSHFLQHELLLDSSRVNRKHLPFFQRESMEDRRNDRTKVQLTDALDGLLKLGGGFNVLESNTNPYIHPSKTFLASSRVHLRLST